MPSKRHRQAYPSRASKETGICFGPECVAPADGGQLASVMAFTFAAGTIAEIYILADSARLTRLGWQ